MERADEVIIPVMAPDHVVSAMARRGWRAVRADLDPETLSMTPSTVLERVTVDTRGVFVMPWFGVMGHWEALRSVTEPRGIMLEVEGKGVLGRWERLTAGVRGMPNDLIAVDGQVITGGARGFRKALRQAGIEAGELTDWQGRRRDYPGMSRIAAEVLVVTGWSCCRAEIIDCASREARQQSLPFEQPRRLPLQAETDGLSRRRAG